MKSSTTSVLIRDATCPKVIGVGLRHHLEQIIPILKKCSSFPNI